MPLSDLCRDEVAEDGGDDGSQSAAEGGSSVSDSGSRDREREAKLEANRKKTQKARETVIVNRWKRKAGVSLDNEAEESAPMSTSWARRLQDRFLTPKLNAVGPVSTEKAFAKCNTKQIAIERGRAVKSILVQIVGMIQRVLNPNLSSGIHQILDCVILDDTSARLQDQDHMPSVHTITNTVQTLHIVYNDQSCESVPLPSPMICLSGQKTEDVYAAYASHLIVSNDGIGYSIRALEKAVANDDREVKIEEWLRKAKWKIQVFVGDAAKTNTAVFKYQKHLQQRLGEARKLSMQIKCMLHQVCLVRRPAALSISGYWCTLVRLGHLFEQWSFKRQFGLALLQLLRLPGKFQRVLVEMNCNDSTLLYS